MKCVAFHFEDQRERLVVSEYIADYFYLKGIATVGLHFFEQIVESYCIVFIVTCSCNWKVMRRLITVARTGERMMLGQ